MSSIIKFKAVSGAFDDSPLCYLLQIDEYKFLLDCGWDEKCSEEILELYKQNLKSVDAILLSYPDLQHIGALPYLITKLNLTCQIFSTVPVYKMGQMFLYDFFLSKKQNEEFHFYDMDDIDSSFEKVQQLKYSQTINLKGKGQGLQITALPAGHMIGGTIWKILKDGEEEIIYAVDYNHHKERHLNGCALDCISKPTLLITDSFNFLYNQTKRRARDEKLLENILNTLRNDGNIMICTDTAGRVLELAHFLDQLWKNENSGLFSYSIALLNNVSISVIEFAKSQVEWMNDKIVQSFEIGRFNPFEFKHLKLCCSLNDLNRITSPSKNKLVLISLSDLEVGYGRNLLLEWCENPKNTIIFTNRPATNTLGYKLFQNIEKNMTISFELKKRVELEGEELEEYCKKAHEKEKEEQERLKKSKELESIDGSSSSDEDENSISLTNNFLNGNHDIMKIQQNKNRFFKHNKKQFPMFPYKEEHIKWDDYGEIIKPDDFLYLSDLNKQPELNDVIFEDESNIINQSNNKEVPTKCVNELINLTIKCKILYIDYEGKSDGESIKKILSNIKPKNLIIVHGDKSSTLEMKEYCEKQQIVQNRIFTPKIGEIVNATIETQIYNVKLKDELVSSLNFQKIKDYELSWIDAVIKNPNLQENEFEINQKIEQNNFDLGFSLHPLNKENIKFHKTVFVNEPKLSDLKQIFTQNAIQAEFHGGVLVCNGVIALKKNQSGRIILEGVISDDYYKVRRILYDQYAML